VLLVIKMVYRKRRYASKRARIPMRKTTRRKYTPRRRYNRSDTGYSEKIMAIQVMKTDGGAGLATLNINWNAVNGASSNDTNMFFWDRGG
jgi:hypothetical protein